MQGGRAKVIPRPPCYGPRHIASHLASPESGGESVIKLQPTYGVFKVRGKQRRFAIAHLCILTLSGLLSKYQPQLTLLELLSYDEIKVAWIIHIRTSKQ